MNEIATNAILLAKDPFGHYVLEHIVDDIDTEKMNSTLDSYIITGILLTSQFHELSCHEFARFTFSF